MIYTYPTLFKQMWGEKDVKAAFVSENAQLQPSDCPNCGGSGRMTTFIAKEGPFNTPGGIGISKYANGKWWVGQHFTALCPICQGDGKKRV